MWSKEYSNMKNDEKQRKFCLMNWNEERDDLKDEIKFSPEMFVER